ncbi:phosphatidylinositol-specific phospholipase C/glycerophosphodiester phosphodiesterase family protein [Martelella sp. HB161492]|uniref:phosphatidylinositol-specific phospholipase C/glycerophosphodiester phosphodiesterase family protein n=1 Tax=Martelella sp. HB161492 TaxID=2720726 RepID=UPI0015907572|nr:phosphatidylinositol-specific phospholipase C/glycerophosphodiester phosphodiesterase family protein [Martelella sp. HB161492]
MLRFFPAFLMSLFLTFPAFAVTPLDHAHAHNDYWHQRPLFDALDRGFMSIEADIMLRDGRLLVGHTAAELGDERSLQALYLDPLLARVRDNDGKVYADQDQPLILLVDLKQDGPDTYRALEKLLPAYAGMLTSYRDGVVTPGAVTLVLTGSSAWQVLRMEKERYAFTDASYVELNLNMPPEAMVMLSQKWTQITHWKGEGPLNDNEDRFIRKIIAKGHERGAKVRFYATPDEPGPGRDAVWTYLLDAGADLLNTDDLNGLSAFFAARAASAEK